MPVFRLFLMFLLLTVSVSHANTLRTPPSHTASLTDVIAAVESPFRLDRSGMPLLQNVRADFFQRSTIADKQKEIRADGHMYFKPATSSEPLMFRFEYYRPTTQEVICDGRTLWVYLPENKQVIVSDVAEFFDPALFNPARDRAINFLQGLGRISKDFTITFGPEMQDIAGNYILELRPRRASVTVEKLFITVSRSALMLKSGGTPGSIDRQFAEPDQRLFAILSTTVRDHDGNSTTIEFSNIRINSMISDLTFRFDAPLNVQVVRPPSGNR